MTIDRYVRLFAGSFVLLSLALGAPASPVFRGESWLWFTAFVGANLLQSSMTGFCPLVNVLRALGVREPAPQAGGAT
jgi:Inner membrane protein YgaP-like, transmembrane domain